HCGDVRDEVECLRALPGVVAAWDAALRARWLDAARTLAPALALAAYRDLPAALDCVDAMARLDLLAAWTAGARGAGATQLADVTPMLPAILCGVPTPGRVHAVSVVAGGGREFGPGVPGLLRGPRRVFGAARPGGATG